MTNLQLKELHVLSCTGKVDLQKCTIKTLVYTRQSDLELIEAEECQVDEYLVDLFYYEKVLLQQQLKSDLHVQQNTANEAVEELSKKYEESLTVIDAQEKKIQELHIQINQMFNQLEQVGALYKIGQ